MSAISVSGLTITIDGVARVRDVSLAVDPGEVLAIVGESGAGKSLVLSALLGFAPRGATVHAEALTVAGTSMLGASQRTWRGVRGRRVGLVSQDALSSLDPLRRVGAEVAEPLQIHGVGTRESRQTRVLDALRQAAVPEVEMRSRQFPHELSGGLRQRALIASAVAADPEILLADEPTTALDATVQVRILELLRGLADDGRAMIFVSHDLTAVSRIADRIIVMRSGEVVEQGAAADVLGNPTHPYTRELMAAAAMVPAAATIAGDEIMRADGIVVNYGERTAVARASIVVNRGETLGIVGESGSGKSTLANVLMGVLTPDYGAVGFDGVPWNPAPESSRRPMRTRIQLVAQNPGASLNPRWSIRRSLDEALRVAGRVVSDDAIAALLRDVELPADVADRRPSQLSGGQQQRAAIARALAVEPDVLVLDEPLSALDVSVQATIIALLRRLQAERDIAMVFISHDLGVVGALAHRIAVMKDGAIVESGTTSEVFAAPTHPFTTELLAASRLA